MKDFWHIVRNGLLHQVAFAWVRVDRQGRVFIMPRLCITGADTNSPDIITYYLSDNFFVSEALGFCKKGSSGHQSRLSDFLGLRCAKFPAPQVFPMPEAARKPNENNFHQQTNSLPSATGCPPQQPRQ